MKIISLNTWGGRVHDPLLDFFKKNQDADIFCLQEIYHQAPEPIVEDKGDSLNLLSEIEIALPDHRVYFKPHFEDYFGIAVLVKNTISVRAEGDIFVYDSKSSEKGNHSRNLQFIGIEHDGSPLTVANVHGLWNGKGKTDSEERLEQSKRIVDFMKTTKGDKILCGDFNLLPDTESIKIIEDSGMDNLIKKYGITSTRTPLYKKVANPVQYADYAFVSEEIKVRDFKVLPDVVSDHAPLLLEI